MACAYVVAIRQGWLLFWFTRPLLTSLRTVRSSDLSEGFFIKANGFVRLLCSTVVATAWQS